MLLLQSKINWPVGETVNSHAFHACIHGFESRTGHHFSNKRSYDRFFYLYKHIICDMSDTCYNMKQKRSKIYDT